MQGMCEDTLLQSKVTSMSLRAIYLPLVIKKRTWTNPGSSSHHAALASFPHVQRELAGSIGHPLPFKGASPQPACRRKCRNMSTLLQGSTVGKCLTGTLWQGERAMSKRRWQGCTAGRWQPSLSPAHLPLLGSTQYGKRAPPQWVFESHVCLFFASQRSQCPPSLPWIHFTKKKIGLITSVSF